MISRRTAENDKRSIGKTYYRWTRRGGYSNGPMQTYTASGRGLHTGVKPRLLRTYNTLLLIRGVIRYTRMDLHSGPFGYLTPSSFPSYCCYPRAAFDDVAGLYMARGCDRNMITTIRSVSIYYCGRRTVVL